LAGSKKNSGLVAAQAAAGGRFEFEVTLCRPWAHDPSVVLTRAAEVIE